MVQLISVLLLLVRVVGEVNDFEAFILPIADDFLVKSGGFGADVQQVRTFVPVEVHGSCTTEIFGDCAGAITMIETWKFRGLALTS